MDYLTFIDDIDKIWTEQNNSKICREYSMNRSVLPALIKLNREWNTVFNSQTEDLNKLDLELNHYKSSKDLSNYVELEKKLDDLNENIIELREENMKYRDEITILERKNSDLQNSSFLKKLVG